MGEEVKASFRLSGSGREVDEHDLVGAGHLLESVKEPLGVLARANGRVLQHPDDLVGLAGRDVSV